MRQVRPASSAHSKKPDPPASPSRSRRNRNHPAKATAATAASQAVTRTGLDPCHEAILISFPLMQLRQARRSVVGFGDVVEAVGGGAVEHLPPAARPSYFRPVHRRAVPQPEVG